MGGHTDQPKAAANQFACLAPERQCSSLSLDPMGPLNCCLADSSQNIHHTCQDLIQPRVQGLPLSPWRAKRPLDKNGQRAQLHVIGLKGGGEPSTFLDYRCSDWASSLLSHSCLYRRPGNSYRECTFGIPGVSSQSWKMPSTDNSGL